MKRILLSLMVAAGITSNSFGVPKKKKKSTGISSSSARELSRISANGVNYQLILEGGVPSIVVRQPNKPIISFVVGTGADKIYVEGGKLYLDFPGAREKHVYDIGSDPINPARIRIEKY